MKKKTLGMLVIAVGVIVLAFFLYTILSDSRKEPSDNRTISEENREKIIENITQSANDSQDVDPKKAKQIMNLKIRCDFKEFEDRYFPKGFDELKEKVEELLVEKDLWLEVQEAQVEKDVYINYAKPSVMFLLELDNRYKHIVEVTYFYEDGMYELELYEA